MPGRRHISCICHSFYPLCRWFSCFVMTYCRIRPDCREISLRNLCTSWTEGPFILWRRRHLLVISDCFFCTKHIRLVLFLLPSLLSFTVRFLCWHIYVCVAIWRLFLLRYRIQSKAAWDVCKSVLRDFAPVFICHPVDSRVHSGRRSDHSAGTSFTARPVQVGAGEIRGRRTA